jgi:hypothetical protein
MHIFAKVVHYEYPLLMLFYNLKVFLHMVTRGNLQIMVLPSLRHERKPPNEKYNVLLYICKSHVFLFNLAGNQDY